MSGRGDIWLVGAEYMTSEKQNGTSEYLRLLHVDTMGFWAPHVREAVEVFGQTG